MYPSPVQIALVILVVVLLFGAGRLGDIGKGLGEGIRNFKKGLADENDDKKLGDKSKDKGDEEKV